MKMLVLSRCCFGHVVCKALDALPRRSSLGLNKMLLTFGAHYADNLDTRAEPKLKSMDSASPAQLQ